MLSRSYVRIIKWQIVNAVSNHCRCFKKKQNALRPTEHPPVEGGEMSKRLVGGIKGCNFKEKSERA